MMKNYIFNNSEFSCDVIKYFKSKLGNVFHYVMDADGKLLISNETFNYSVEFVLTNRMYIHFKRNDTSISQINFNMNDNLNWILYDIVSKIKKDM